MSSAAPLRRGSVLVVLAAAPGSPRSTSRLSVGDARRLLIQIGEQLLCVAIADPQNWHAHTGEFFGHREHDWIFVNEHLLGIPDEVRQPGAIAPRGHVAQVGSDAIPDADRVAGRAYSFEQDLTRLIVGHYVSFYIQFFTLRGMDLVQPHRIHLANGYDQTVEIAEHRSPLPIPYRIVAEHDFVAVIAQIAVAAVAEFVIDGSDVRHFSGQKQPTRSDVESVGKCLHPLRRIVFWIDRHGNEEEVASDCTIKLVLQLRHLGCRERTEILATRVDEADDDDLAFNDVVIKIQCSAVLVDYGHVGEVVRSPPVAWPLGCGLRGGSRLRLGISRPAYFCCAYAVL